MYVDFCANKYSIANEKKVPNRPEAPQNNVIDYKGFQKVPSEKINLALRGITFAGLNKVRGKTPLEHRYIEQIDHPIYGKVKHFELFNPKNDVSEGRQQVYIIEKHSVPLVTIATNILTGSVNENDKNNGISHFLEHLVFKGTMNPDGTLNMPCSELMQKIEDLGADMNAYTGFDSTLYLASIPKEKFAEAVKLHTDMVLHPAIPEDELNRERKVVIEEIGISKNDSYDTGSNRLYQKIFSPHPYKRTVLGPRKNIQTITKEELMDYHRNFYKPNNRQILVIGDIKADEALKHIKTHYNTGEIEPAIIPERKNPSTRATKPASRGIEGMEGSAETFIGFHGPAPSNVKESSAMNLLSIILGGGCSSRLIQDILEKKRKVVDIDAALTEYKDYTVFLIHASEKYRNIEKVQDLIFKHLDKVINKGITEEELEKARIKAEYTIASAVDSYDNMILHLGDTLATRQLKEHIEQLQAIKELKPEDIQEVAKKYLSPTKARVFNLIPKEELSKGKKVSFTGKLAPEDTSIKLANGTELVVRNIPDSLITSISILVKGGDKTDTKIAQSHLMANMLMRGTTTKSAKEFSNLIDELGIDLTIDRQPDGISISASSLNRTADDLIRIISEMISRPRFLSRNKDVQLEVDKDFRTQRKLIKDTLSQVGDVAKDGIMQSVFEETNPYGVTETVIEDNIRKVEPGDVKRAYRKLFVPSNMTIAVVGNVEPAHAKTLFNEKLSLMKDHAVEIPEIKPEKIQESLLTGVTEIGTEQAVIYKAWKAPKYNSVDHVPMRVLRNILCYGFSSRLFSEFREKREGLCYDVSTSYKPMIDDGMFTMKVETNPKNIDECMKLFDEQISKLLKDGVNQKELDRVKLILKTNLLLNKTKTREVSKGIAEHRGLNIISDEERLAKIDAVTVEDVNKVARKYLSRPHVTTVTASEKTLNKAKIESKKNKAAAK